MVDLLIALFWIALALYALSWAVFGLAWLWVWVSEKRILRLSRKQVDQVL